MKEAAGEANMTVITIVLIAIVLAIGTVIVTSIMEGTEKQACLDAGGTWESNACSYNKTKVPGYTDKK